MTGTPTASAQRDEGQPQGRETAARTGTDPGRLTALHGRESQLGMPEHRPFVTTPRCSGLASLAAELERCGRGNESQGATPPESGALARKRAGAWRSGQGRARKGLSDPTEQRSGNATGSPRREWERRWASGEPPGQAATRPARRVCKGSGSSSPGRRSRTVEMRDSEASSKIWSVG